MMLQHGILSSRQQFAAVTRTCAPQVKTCSKGVSASCCLQSNPLRVGSVSGLTPLKISAPKRLHCAPVKAEAAADEGPKFLGVKTETWQKIVPLGLMFFCILFNYTILRDTKDVLVVTAPGSGAEIIPFLKTWVNLPMAIGFTIIYTKLSNVLSPEQLFYACLIPFVIFFGSFAYLIYPARDFLHPTAFCEQLLQTAGERFMGPIAVLRNWSYCLFYVMAELWGSVVVSVLFWGLANTITTVDEAKQFYPLFGLGANVALIFSGKAVKYFSQVRENLPAHIDGWGYSLKGMMGMVVIGGFLIGALHLYLVNSDAAKKVKAAGLAKGNKKKKKSKMSVGESFKFLAQSPYIRDLATLVVAYGISINLVEVTWKSKLKAQYPDPNAYSSFMGDFSTATGTVTFFLMIASRFIFQKFGWGVAALITPTVLLATGVVFFALVLYSGPLTPMMASFGLTPLMAAVLVGAAQNIFSKGSKYSLFDPCKEMAYIPLDDEVKTKGKAAIDVICNPLGKSGGALIQQFMIIGFGSLAASTPYLAATLFVIVFAWLRAAVSLSKQFAELQGESVETTQKKQAFQDAKNGVNMKKHIFVQVPSDDKKFIEQKYVAVEDVSSLKGDEVVMTLQEEEAAKFNKAMEAAKQRMETDPASADATVPLTPTTSSALPKKD